jgi:phosphoribosylanthranilate isomerase
MTKLKICGLFRPCDMEFVNEAKPDWCGFIVNFPKSHRNVTPERLRELRKKLDNAITPVGVFVNQPVEEVAALLRDGTISVAQLHGGEDEAYLAALRTLAPGFPVWKAFRVRGREDLAAVESSSADLVLLDSGQGTGQTFDWSLARVVSRPFLLAGGLTPDNIPQAIQAVHPYGLDLSSGVETERKKDKAKILAAVAAAHTQEKGELQ